jgi:V-type H+-transporting ATPase subunit d
MSAIAQNSTSDDAKRDVLESLWWTKDSSPIGGLATFNADFGYIEAILRGFRSGFLKPFEYRQLSQCETLDDVKLTLGDTDYCNVLTNLNKLTPEIILKRCEEKFVAEFFFCQAQATGQLASFLDYVTYEDLITNISFLITSMIKGADPANLLHKTLPLGNSAHLRSVLTFDNKENSDPLFELYRTVLIDTPVAPYFENYFSSEVKGDGSASHDIQRIYNEVEIDIITNMLQKLWLEDFYSFCKQLGGETATVMCELLEFEADRRAISIMMNSFSTNLNDPANRDTERKKLFCRFGKFYPELTLMKFSTVSDMSSLAAVIEPYKQFSELYRISQEGQKTFEDLLYEEEVRLCRTAFDGQSHFASFYAFVKLKKQELRNIKWILSCINLKRDAKDFNKWIKTF